MKNLLELKSKNEQSGFTLLEMLVAMAILSVIVLSLTTVFNQSNQAWSRGLSKSQKGMEGRAVLNMIATELKNAVAADYLKDNNIQNGSSIGFNTIGKSGTSSDRVIQYVEYKFSGGKVIRTASKYNNDYSALSALGGPSELADNVSGFSVKPYQPGTYVTNLPETVEVSIQLKMSSNIAWAEAKSAGPNGNLGDKDDLSSEEQ